jgi:hypothetical protein
MRGGVGGRGLPMAGFPVGGPGSDLDPLMGLGGHRSSSGGGGSGGGSGGAKRSMQLAQHQGNYGGAHGHYSAGPGRNLLAGQFMSEALRQQLQQYNYLIQSQVGRSVGGALGGFY